MEGNNLDSIDINNFDTPANADDKGTPNNGDNGNNGDKDTPPNPNPNPPNPNPNPNGDEPNPKPNPNDDGNEDGDNGDEEFSLNDNGDVVNAEGEILIAKADVVYDDDGNVVIPETPLIDDIRDNIATNFGIDFGEDKYEDTDEGINQMFKRAVELSVEKERKEFAEANPRIAAYQQHVMAGGTDDSYFSVGDKWRNHSLPADDVVDSGAVNARKQLITEHYLTRFGYYDAGTSNERKTAILTDAREHTELIETSGKLVEKSKAALDDLQAIETNNEKLRDSENAMALEKMKQDTAKHWKKVETITNNGNLKGINIPEADRKEFFKYISQDVTGNGQTQEALDAQDEELELKLQMAYFRYKKFNLNDLVKLQVGKAKAKNLRDRRSKKKIVIANKNQQNGNGGGQGSSNVYDINNF